ncbi:antibiotic biosynthesis monooxygenase [Aureimonas flava]|uniref:Antibiotic biosynthesis monooxygenase n=1 Tax=Aureimonas flava TaxID=2320271 RepID=A0A3A1WSH4_9HYPH|nr:putative quinol monooxygenase [Aureimonas flava]RIY03675.1 antibiotic biosynthesis monooxygenase [Aureimonas flava]
MLILIGHIDVAPGDVEAFAADMAVFAPRARARDGCLFFGVAAEDPGTGRMLVAERWRDQAALDAHRGAADTIAFVARWGDRMRGDLKQFDVLEPEPTMASET